MRTEDGRIIQECLNGESEAFGMLVDKYKEGIYAFVYNKLLNFQDAQDVTQEVFLKAYKDLHSLKRLESFAFWLYRIAYSRCIEFLRSKSRRVDTDSIEDQDTKIIDAHSMNYYRENQISESVRDALDSLPEAYREALMLHYFGGMNSNEIANALGTSPTAIRMRLSRAREQMKEEILAVMGTAFEGWKLRIGFTFRVVEAIKQIRVQPISPKTLPWGISLGAGLIFTVLMFGQHIQINLPDISMGLPLPSDMKVLKVGEIPVDAVKVSTITSIGNKGDGKGVAPDPKGQENAFFMAPQDNGKWEKKADMPTPRVGFCSVMIDGIIYNIGGGNLQALFNSTTEAYNPITNIWVKKADLNVQRIFFSAVDLNGKIYAMGGMLADGGTSIPTVEEYDPIIDKWTLKNDMPVSRSLFSSASLNGKIYIFGGWHHGSHSDCYIYEPVTDTWNQIADLPIPLIYSQACILNDKIYVIGGTDWWIKENFNRIFEYDVNKNIWTNKTNMPNPRIGFSMNVLNGKIYVIGGYSRQDITSVIDVYDPISNSWGRELQMTEGRGWHSAAIVQNKLYVVGGTHFYAGPLEAIGWPPRDVSSITEEYIPQNVFSIKPQDRFSSTWGTIKHSN
jgi:RNA polymerase sigma factor (sigma-70 family)